MRAFECKANNLPRTSSTKVVDNMRVKSGMQLLIRNWMVLNNSRKSFYFCLWGRMKLKNVQFLIQVQKSIYSFFWEAWCLWFKSRTPKLPSKISGFIQHKSKIQLSNGALRKIRIYLIFKCNEFMSTWLVYLNFNINKKITYYWLISSDLTKFRACFRMMFKKKLINFPKNHFQPHIVFIHNLSILFKHIFSKKIIIIKIKKNKILLPTSYFTGYSVEHFLKQMTCS